MRNTGLKKMLRKIGFIGLLMMILLVPATFAPFINTTQYFNNFSSAGDYNELIGYTNATRIEGGGNTSLSYWAISVSGESDTTASLAINPLFDNGHFFTDLNPGGFWYIELDQNTTINSMYVKGGSAAGVDALKEYNISVSNDTVSWQVVYKEQNATSHLDANCDFDNLTAKYIKFEGLKRGDNAERTQLHYTYINTSGTGDFIHTYANNGSIHLQNLTFGGGTDYYNSFNVTFASIIPSGSGVNLTVNDDSGNNMQILNCYATTDELEYACNGTLFLSTANYIWYEFTLHNYDGVSNPEILNITLLRSNLVGTSYTNSYDSAVFEGEQNEYNLNVTYTGEPVNITATFVFNGTSYDITEHYNTSDTYVFKSNFTMPFITYGTNATGFGEWNYTVLEGASNYTISANFNQTVQPNLQVSSVCNATTPYSVLNLTYYDSVDDRNIIIDNVFDLIFDDGTYDSISLVGNFSSVANSSFCTNTLTDHSWDVTGNFILSADSYATRIYDYSSDNLIVADNVPTTLLDLFLTGLSNSTTVTFNWLTTNYELLDGSMKIYQCDDTGTKTLISQIGISNGVAYENLILTTQPYAYSVIVDGVEYNESSYYDCHIEYNSEATYYVDITTSPIQPIGGLLNIPCSLVENPAGTVTMSWGANPYDDTSIQGCIQGINFTIGGGQIIFSSCTNTTDYSQVYVLPESTDYVFGLLIQGSEGQYCDDVIRPSLPTDDPLGISALFALALMLLGVAVMLAESDIVMSIGVAIVLGGAVLVGITVFGWVSAALACIFLLLTGFIGRYTRKRD